MRPLKQEIEWIRYPVNEPASLIRLVMVKGPVVRSVYLLARCVFARRYVCELPFNDLLSEIQEEFPDNPNDAEELLTALIDKKLFERRGDNVHFETDVSYVQNVRASYREKRTPKKTEAKQSEGTQKIEPSNDNEYKLPQNLTEFLDENISYCPVGKVDSTSNIALPLFFDQKFFKPLNDAYCGTANGVPVLPVDLSYDDRIVGFINRDLGKIQKNYSRLLGDLPVNGNAGELTIIKKLHGVA